MKLISVRSNFTAAAFFGQTLTQYPPALPVPGYPTDLAGWLLISGYHTTAGDAEASYAEIERRVPTASILVSRLTGFLWPGGDLAIDFPLAVIRAREAGWRLADIMCGQDEMRQPRGYVSQIHAETHSLAARLLAYAVCTGAFNMGHVILTAPAIDEDSLQPGGEFEAMAHHCQSLNIFYSANDPVLRNVYPLNSFGRHQALGLRGPTDPSKMLANVRLFDCSRVVSTHGGYRYCSEFYAAWASIIDGTAKPGLTVL